jgi:YVTN family beta-propeller protein
MYSNNRNGRRATSARGFMALCALLALGLGLMASQVEAAPFAYVANEGGSVSVIDTATNTVVATVPVGGVPIGVAVTPDGKHAYVANFTDGTVSVIATATSNTTGTPIPVGNGPEGVAITPDGKHAYVTNSGTLNVPGTTVSVIATASNTVVATVKVGNTPSEVAVTPDGKHVYVTNFRSDNVSVIATANNTVVATVNVGNHPDGVAVTPDGKHVYVANYGSADVSVIATATNTVAATVNVGNHPDGVAVTPDGKHAYVANGTSDSVSVIDTANNTVVATRTVGVGPDGVAVTPDGKHVYVTNGLSNTVSVIDTATTTVEAATVPVGLGPFDVAIVPPPPGVPFLTFNANLNIAFGTAPNTDAFIVGTSFTLSRTAPGFNPLTDPVILQIGTFAVTIPPGSFQKNHVGNVIFTGVINGVTLEALIKPTGTLRYAGSGHARQFSENAGCAEVDQRLVTAARNPAGPLPSAPAPPCRESGKGIQRGCNRSKYEGMLYV